MEELDLKGLLEVFWEKKVLIIIIMLVFILVGILYSYLYVKPVYELVLKNQEQVLNDLRENSNTKQIAKMVDNDFRLHNYDLIHALGHGVGLDIHEAPVLGVYSENTLKENMVVTNEPGIYIAGQFGVRIEDTVLINKGSCEALTKSPKKYIIIK